MPPLPFSLFLTLQTKVQRRLSVESLPKGQAKTTLISLIFVILNFHDFCDLKNFAKLKTCENKVRQKLKTKLI